MGWQQNLTDEERRREEQRRDFVRDELVPFTKAPWIIADRRIAGRYGTSDGDEQGRDWRAREANRFIAERYRERDLWFVKLSIWIAIAIGVCSVVATTLAIPTKDSLYSLARHVVESPGESRSSAR